MKTGMGTLSAIQADRGTRFWLWLTVKLSQGVSQMVALHELVR